MRSTAYTSAARSRRDGPTTRWRGLLLPGAYLILWCGCVLFGGSSRIDSPWLLAQRPIAVACLFLFLVRARGPELRDVRRPLMLLLALAAIMLVQLVPLPPGLWRALPGRDQYARALALAGAESRWLPISVAPDRTWSSLAALVTPVAVLLGYSAMPRRVREWTLPALIAVGLLSALVGLLQIVGGDDSPFYYYPSSNIGFPIGFLTNRNHAGAFLALMIPALRAWSVERTDSALASRRRRWLARGGAVFLVPMVFVTGSRAGLALLVVGVLGAFAVAPVRVDPRRVTMRGWAVLAGVAALAVLGLAAVVTSGRAAALDRLLGSSVLSDARFDYTPVVLTALRSAFPVGWGFGTFDLVFRTFEPDRMLTLTYVNNAHDDLLELLLTGGVAAGLVLLAFLWWFGTRATAVFREGARPSAARARAAVVMAAMLMLASLADYPLRAPLLGAAFALLCAWIADGASRREPKPRVASQQLSL